MFDYQAGEKYKLTIIMVALAGFMAGVFLTVMLMPTPEPSRRKVNAAYMRDPDITGRNAQQLVSDSGAAQAMIAPPVSGAVEPLVAKVLITQWLPLAWDLSAGTAKGNQEKAIMYMTPECASAYTQNIWTPDLAKQIDESGLKSSFHADKVECGESQSDGSVVIFVDGIQTLSVPGKGTSSRPVKLEYLVRQTPEGMRIAGISEGGHGL
ncbi:MAG: hypothetical protein HY711_11075 [Candidatus Melainabacteria bacterium]|nr:hypothetical protein [Candidatus Melainabacteria bacterium]